jgi:2-oxoisovalerate dehydrogenase E1 component
MKFSGYKISKKKQLELFKALKRPRLIEEKMLSLLRQGKISKWFSGIGQEAIAVGCAMALDEDEFIFPMHRNLGVFTSREIPLYNLFCQWQGKKAGFTNGRDRSFHFGTLDYKVIGMISHLGAQLSLADGVALANKLANKQKIALAFTGEGATSEGEFHEALNMAAVWELPVIFVVENNGYGLSTPTDEQFKCKNIADKGIGYGIKSMTIDGNNILEVYQTVSKLAKQLRKKPEPILLECKTFRMRGHEEASGTKYVPQELMDHWAKKDPIANFEQFLIKQKQITVEEIESIETDIKAEIKQALKEAESTPRPEANHQTELVDVYAKSNNTVLAPTGKSQQLRYIDAISEALDMAMEKHDNLVLMGQDIAEYGGVFKITDGFTEKYGRERVRNTPICESAVVGIGMGLSLAGFKAMVEMQFSDFVTCGFNQIINNLAKVHYRWSSNADVVIRMPAGGGVGAGPFHSQTNEMWFVHTPGLKVVYPSSPKDAKGLLLASFEDPNPVMFFEHKALYRTLDGEVPQDYYTIPIGKANLVQEGTDLSIITYGQTVHWAKTYCEDNQISADILDLRSLVPLDYDAIDQTVKKTSKVLLLHEDVMIGGLGGELSAYITEHLFEYLDAPILRVASLNMPIPFAGELENIYLPKERMETAIQKLLNY